MHVILVENDQVKELTCVLVCACVRVCVCMRVCVRLCVHACYVSAQVLHIIFQDGFNPAKEDLRDLIFIISVSTAFIGVIVFIGVCFLLDYLEMKGIIKKHR